MKPFLPFLLIVSLSILLGCKRSKPAQPTSSQGLDTGKPTSATMTAIPALRAFAPADKRATEWKQDAYLVDAIVEHSISRHVIQAFSPMAKRATVAKKLTEPQKLGFSVQEVEIAEDAPTPLLFAWLFIFRSGNDHLAVHVSASDTTSESGALLPDVGAAPVKDWRIDSTQVIDIARKAGATEREGYFRVKTWNVNGEQVPIWTVPFQMQDGTLFVIRADTGQILTSESEQAMRAGRWIPYKPK